jgi:primary-amine oxidase
MNIARSALCLCLLSFACAAAPASHPLDPLDDSEIIGAAQILLAAGAARPGAIFQSVELQEPPKDFVLAFHAGDPIPRFARVFYRQNERSFKTVVNLGTGTFSDPVLIPRRDGQLGLTIQEIFDFSFLFDDPAFLSAMAARDIDTPEELAHVLVTPLTASAFGLPEEQHRIVKAQMYFLEGAGVNLYAKPIEGVQAIADLDAQQVIEVLDSGVVPVPAVTYNFDEASVADRYGLRDPLKPIRITQPEGANFTLADNFVEWQKWRFHVRFDRRVGTVLSLVTYDGRSVMYEGSLSEVFVPYQDPDQNWYYRMFMDAGEFGFGALASPLTLGLDVPENAMLLDAVISAALPDPKLPVIPLPLDNVIGLFERVTGNPIWRHYEAFAPGGPQYEGRAEVELVVRMAAQLGNYDYVIDWIFSQSGTIRAEVSLTGIDIPKGVVSTSLTDPTAPKDTAHGALVAPNLVATYHSHHFNFRLDMDIDGRSNSFMAGKLVPQDTGGSSPRQSVWAPRETLLRRESQGRLSEDVDLWRIVNRQHSNAQGYQTGYLLESEGNVTPLMSPEDFRRALFIGYNLWVTAYRADERYAAGDTPNQNPGTPGLPRYISDDENLVDADLVLWVTLGFHHVTSAEDFPVLPREHASFELKPANFFDRNPALDLRRSPFEVD